MRCRSRQGPREQGHHSSTPRHHHPTPIAGGSATRRGLIGRIVPLRTPASVSSAAVSKLTASASNNPRCYSMTCCATNSLIQSGQVRFLSGRPNLPLCEPDTAGGRTDRSSDCWAPIGEVAGSTPERARRASSLHETPVRRETRPGWVACAAFARCGRRIASNGAHEEIFVRRRTISPAISRGR